MSETSAVVLGGGGLSAIGWSTGVLAALAHRERLPDHRHVHMPCAVDELPLDDPAPQQCLVQGGRAAELARGFVDGDKGVLGHAHQRCRITARVGLGDVTSRSGGWSVGMLVDLACVAPSGPAQFSTVHMGRFINMEQIETRKRNLPAPSHAVFEDLVNPHRSRVRPWLHLLGDEVEPEVLESRAHDLVVWSSLWVRRPDVRIAFELPDGEDGTDIRWTMYADEPLPDDNLTRHLRKRLNTLIHANLRYTYGQ